MLVDQDPTSLSPRRLTTVDAANGVRLSTQADWNQVEHDWDVMIQMGQGIGLVDTSDRLIATVILLPFLPQVDWVSMVLVDVSWRGQGIGTRLLSLATKLSPNPILGLDATDQGVPLYERLGFVASETITRYRRAGHIASIPGPSPGSGPGPAPTPTLAPARAPAPNSAPDWRQLETVTEGRFGELLTRFARETDETRRMLLQKLAPAQNGNVCLARRGDTAAVASIRPGRTSEQIGPIFAADVDSAMSLLHAIAASQTEPLIVDAHDKHIVFAEELSRLGFEATRRFTRMFRGDMPTPNPFEFATAGPEFG